jgi:hypothetical protein
MRLSNAEQECRGMHSVSALGRSTSSVTALCTQSLAGFRSDLGVLSIACAEVHNSDLGTQQSQGYCLDPMGAKQVEDTNATQGEGCVTQCRTCEAAVCTLAMIYICTRLCQ